MAFDEGLGERVRQSLKKEPDLGVKRMFGGLAFLVQGNMFCGVVNKDLMLRLGAEQAEKALRRPHVRPMDFTGRPLKGYVYVGSRGTATKRDLEGWLKKALQFAKSLPKKKNKTSSI